MNKRIRKKKAKQQLIRAISGLMEAAEEMQREQEGAAEAQQSVDSPQESDIQPPDYETGIPNMEADGEEVL